MTNIISFANQKGGVGKTSLAIGVAAALRDQGKKVLVIDLDPQGHLSEGLGINESKGESLASILFGDSSSSVESVAVKANGLFVCAASDLLYSAESRLNEHPARENRLSKALNNHPMPFDIVIIDNQPAVSALSNNGLLASTHLVPVLQGRDASLRALGILSDQVSSLREAYNRAPDFLGVVLNELNAQTKATQRVREALQKEKTPILAEIPVRTAITEAWREGKPTQDFAPNLDINATFASIATILTNKDYKNNV